MKTITTFTSAGITVFFLFLSLLFYQNAMAQDTLNVKLNANPAYKYSSVSDLSEISFNAGETEMIFTFTDASTTTETVSSIVELTFDDAILGGGDPLWGLLASLNLSVGWNMISIPLEVADMTKATLFPTAVSKAWWYNNGYVEAVTLEKGKAYWLKFDAAAATDLHGRRFTGTVPVNSGWNMVGPYYNNVDTSLISYAPINIKQSNYWGYNNGYYAEDILESGKGYWVKLSSAGTLDINEGLDKRDREEPAANSNWGSIIISDNTDKQVTLYASDDISDIKMNMLPPPPPQGILDARYRSGRFIEEIGEQGKEIIISSAAYPVKIKAEGLGIRITAGGDGEELDRNLMSGEELTIRNSKIRSITVSGGEFREIPTRYYVYQNYPNPFNPSTTIKYEIPKDGRVKIEIYNILGEKVKELVNQELEAGYHEVVFSADNLASGAYIYRITASPSTSSVHGSSTGSGHSFVDVKKMMYLK